MIAYWLEELGLIHSFEIKEIAEGSNLYHARVRTDKIGPESMLTDVGFGVSQVLPVLVLLYYVPEGSIVLMEQPEIHLHPSVQSGLADVMLAVATRRKVQLIVESHSEHLLRRFQRRTAEGGIKSSDLKLYFAQNNHGVAELDDLELNSWGEIENWPDHFSVTKWARSQRSAGRLSSNGLKLRSDRVCRRHQRRSRRLQGPTYSTRQIATGASRRS